jgi:hypothetical protein
MVGLGGSFEVSFRRICRLILAVWVMVVWVKNAPKNGPNDTRETPCGIFVHTPSPHISPASCCDQESTEICGAFSHQAAGRTVEYDSAALKSKTPHLTAPSWSRDEIGVR